MFYGIHPMAWEASPSPNPRPLQNEEFPAAENAATPKNREREGIKVS
jgi:hypothetical protein